MKRSIFSAVALIFFISPAIPLQIPTVQYVGGSWIGVRSDGSTLCTNSASYCIAETVAYASPLNLPTIVRSLGKSAPFIMTGVSIPIPPQSQVPFKCIPGCYFEFHNVAQDGFVFDTQMKSKWDNSGGEIHYCGSGVGVRFKPQTALVYAVNDKTNITYTTPWGTEEEYQLGHVEAISDCPYTPFALLAVDVTATCGTDGFSSSQFAANKVFANGIMGVQVANVLYRNLSPTCQYALISQNEMHLGLLQGAAAVEFASGLSCFTCGGDNSGPYDGNISTNTYWMIIQHGIPGAGNWAMLAGGSKNTYHLVGPNNEGPSPLPNYLVYWQAGLGGNRIITPQTFGWNLGLSLQNGTVVQPNVICGYDATHQC